MYIYEDARWPDFSYDYDAVLPILGECHRRQGELLSRVSLLGIPEQENIALSASSDDIIRSSEIEGIALNREQVRSSIAIRLGFRLDNAVHPDHNIDAAVSMMMDAVGNYDKPLTAERLFAWHSCLFPTGYSGMYKIDVSKYRSNPMQVISGALAHEKVYYEAPAAESVPAEMEKFLFWLNRREGDSFINAAVAHLWFLTIHPFDDGNGRIARAITDMLLSGSDRTKVRLYSMSRQIQRERSSYYEALEKAQHGSTDITEWVIWFLKCLLSAIENSSVEVTTAMGKYRYLERISDIPMNERQIKMVHRLINGDFHGVLNTSKWAKLTKCSADTALRDISDLIRKGILERDGSTGGRNTCYTLVKQ